MFKKSNNTKPQNGSAAARGAAASSKKGGDRGFINELYELLDRDNDPKNVVIHELILEQWIQLGDTQMALGVADEILKQEASHPAANEFINRMRPGSKSSRTSRSRTNTTSASTTPPQTSSAKRRSAAEQPSLKSSSAAATSTKKSRQPIRVGAIIKTEAERQRVEAELERKFASLTARATDLDLDLTMLEPTSMMAADSSSKEALEGTRSIKTGHISLVVMPPLPRPVRQLVRELSGDREKSLQLVVDDFVQVSRWSLEEDQSGKAHADVVRDRLLRRQTLLDAMLPTELEGLGYVAMKAVEHQLMQYGKTYANAETMLGDDVADIPLGNLVVTDDNYAWDMSELAQALAVNNGIMRNPLTKDMFSEQDVHQILNHPLGKRLRPMAVEQSQLKNGVRSSTIDRLTELSKVMLEDQSAHATPTISAIDNFLAYCSTLPQPEQKSLKSLKVPAKDTHTGKAYDSAILEAIQDAKGNRVCYHKTGDFLGQAAKYLRESS